VEQLCIIARREGPFRYLPYRRRQSPVRTEQGHVGLHEASKPAAIAHRGRPSPAIFYHWSSDSDRNAPGWPNWLYHARILRRKGSADARDGAVPQTGSIEVIFVSWLSEEYCPTGKRSLPPSSLGSAVVFRASDTNAVTVVRCQQAEVLRQGVARRFYRKSAKIHTLVISGGSNVV